MPSSLDEDECYHSNNRRTSGFAVMPWRCGNDASTSGMRRQIRLRVKGDCLAQQQHRANITRRRRRLAARAALPRILVSNNPVTGAMCANLPDLGPLVSGCSRPLIGTYHHRLSFTRATAEL